MAVKFRTSVLDSCYRVAAKHRNNSKLLDELFIERYGITYSDADCEPIIDSLGYGTGPITVEECDRFMQAYGHPRLK